MADDTVRNVWDVIGLPNSTDRAPIQEREQSLCANGAQEGDLDKAQSVSAQGTSINPKGTAEQSSVSIADVLCSSNLPDEPVQNGGSRIEDIIERHTQRQNLMKVLTNVIKDSPPSKGELFNGEPSATPVEHPAFVANGSAESNVDLLRNNQSNVEECDAVVAVSSVNSDRAEPSEVRQERSIFENINSNFRPPGILSQSRVNTNVANGTGTLGTSVEASVVSNSSRLAAAEEKLETSGITKDKNNIFERVRINSYIDSLTQPTLAREGNREFPFSEKLRQLTNINKESGKNMSATVQPLRTGYDAAFQQLAPMNANSTTSTISARIVNGQLQPVGSQVIIPTEPPKLDSNLIFPSVTPINYSSHASSSVGIKNSYTSKDVMAGYNNNASQVRIQPGAPEKIKFISLDSTRHVAGTLNGESAQTNLKATHLVGPFIGTGPPPPNTYVATIRPTHVQSLPSGLQAPAYHQVQAVPSPLKGHSAASSFQLVLPVLPNQIIMPSPVSVTALERSKVPQTNYRKHDLICSERLISSPELQERVFRPVSPAKSVINATTSPRFTHTQVHFQAPSEFRSSPARVRRSVMSPRSELDRRGSVEAELADQSYECALRESAHSPDIERYLRCESPLTVLSSPNTKRHNYTHEEIDFTKSPPMACNGDSENTEFPIRNGSSPMAYRDDLENNEFLTIPDSPHMAGCSDSENIELSAIAVEECKEGISSAETPEIKALESGVQDTESVSRKKQGNAMIRRLEARLPSPVRERTAGDLYRDPRELTREERALQRAMMQFSEMEMKEKNKEIKKKDSLKRRLRKRPKDKQTTVLNGAKKQLGSNVWLRKLKRRRLWFSQRRSITVKPPAQEDDSTAIGSEDQEAVVVKRKRSNPANADDDQPKRKRKRVEADKPALVTEPKDSSQTTAVVSGHKETENKPAKRVRRSSSDTCGLQETKKENVPKSSSFKRSMTAGDMGKKLNKRARVEIEPLKVNRQEVTLHKNIDGGKNDKSHRVKTYMLVTAYQGFRDFKPVVLESRTRGKSKHADCEVPQQSATKSSEFPLLVVESVHSKPVKNSVIAENEEVQQLVENCLKARGKWCVDETLEEETNDDDTLKEARKLNVNRNTGETILHKAARLGYHETVHHHIHQGVDPNAKDNAGWTPLHEACSRGKVDVVKVLAKYGADVNACSNDGIRPIHDAAEGGHVDVLRVLLTFGADPLLATYSGNTALGCTKDPNTRSFLEGFMEDVDLKSPTLTASETEGCWDFGGSGPILDNSPDQTSGIFEGSPKDGSTTDGEFEMCDRPHLPTYNLPVMQNDELTSGRRNYVLLSDILEHLRIGRGALFKKARKLDIREMPWSQFMAQIADNPLCVVPKHSPPDSSTQEAVAELVPINYNLRRLLNIRVESVDMT